MVAEYRTAIGQYQKQGPEELCSVMREIG